MKKNNNNRGKAAIGAVLAAGMTAGAITAGCGKAAQPTTATPVQPQEANVELTAADKVVIDGREVQLGDEETREPRRDVAKPMYGVRPNPIRLLYGPRPNPRVNPLPADDNQPASIEPRVIEVVAATLNVQPRSVKVMSSLSKDLKLDAEKKKQLKEALERRFEVVIPDDQFNAARTVGDLVNCIGVLKF
jgi:acyl carrier protein